MVGIGYSVWSPWEANGVITPFVRVRLTTCIYRGVTVKGGAKLGEHVPSIYVVVENLHSEVTEEVLRF